MEFEYPITVEDYVVFNRSVALTHPQAKRNLTRGRIQGTLIILAAGFLLTYLRTDFTAWMLSVFVCMAALYAIFSPKFFLRSMEKRVRKMILTAPGIACGLKKLTLAETRLHLVGEGEDSAYEYSAIQQVIRGDAHYFIYVGAVEALIVPDTAFADSAERQSFYEALCEKVTHYGGSLALASTKRKFLGAF